MASSCEVTGFLSFLLSGSFKGVFFFLFLSQAGLSWGQDSLIYQKISIRDTSLKVQQVFDLISKSTGLSLSYNPEIIDLERNVRVEADQESLHSILDRVLEDPSLEYRIIGRQIVLYRPLVIQRSDAEKSSGKELVSVLVVKGRVLDIHNKQPISFAGISLLDKSEGTVANLQGDFLLKIDSRHLQDSLAVACMGYETLVLPVSDFVSGRKITTCSPTLSPFRKSLSGKKIR